MGSILSVTNILLQILDGLTTYVAFSKGLPEVNPYTVYLDRLFGNQYVGVGVEKVAYIGFSVFVFYTIRALARRRLGVLGNVIIGFLDILLVFLALSVGQVVIANFGVIGW